MVENVPRQVGTRPPNPLLPMHARDLDLRLNGKQLIDQVSFSLDGQHRTVILGPNGAGKSLLLRLVHGLLRPSGGTVSWAGMSPQQVGRRVAMVFQHAVMLRRSVAGNVHHVLKVMGVPRIDRSEIVDRTLAYAGLTGMAEHSARTLSGGEQQRLSIARAWALSPQVLLLDEPTSNLDPGATAAVEALIRTVEQSGTKIVMTTHDIAQARRLAGDVLFLHHGRLLEHTGAESFFQRPQTDEASKFIQGELLQ